MENLRWDHTKPYVPFRWIHTEPSMHFKKANTEPSMRFRRDNTEFLYCQSLNLVFCIRSGLNKTFQKNISALHFVAILENGVNLFEIECKSEKKSQEGWGFPRPGRNAPRDFPQASPLGNPLKQSCQPLENPLPPSSFTSINPICR